MSDIPEDLRAMAEAVVNRGYNVGLINAVLAALMAERERCAQIAEQVGNFGDYKREELTKDYGQPRFDMMSEIAAAIRTPHLPSGAAACSADTPDNSLSCPSQPVETAETPEVQPLATSGAQFTHRNGAP